MGKLVKAVRPYRYNIFNSNFKQPLYEEWLKAGGKGVENRQWKGRVQGALYHLDLPTFYSKKSNARMCLVEGASLRFDVFPDYLCHEIIPVFWDCWPEFWGDVERWFKKHNVRSAVFTASQTAEHFRGCFPEMNILTITEGIETCLYDSPPPLTERENDYLEFGRCCSVLDSSAFPQGAKVISSKYHWKERLQTREQLIAAMMASKVTIALTRQDSQPHIAQGVDTLTQRYWECMLSGIVMVGRAPRELTDMIGYDPVIALDKSNPYAQIGDIVAHIGAYQEVVDKNRETALRLGDWSLRAKQIAEWLQESGYSV